jgi:RNA polymerase sigma-70 factor (ECF subfamily)
VTGEGALRVALTEPVAEEAAEFLRLIGSALPGAYNLAGYLLGDATEAEDATQHALEKAWRAWPRIRDRERAGAWFDRIVANVCKDRLRERRGFRVLPLDDEVGESPSAVDPFREALSRDELGRLVRTLPSDQQVVVALRFWRDLSLDEIAERLDVPLGTVKSRLHYALKTLRRQLDRQTAEVAR